MQSTIGNDNNTLIKPTTMNSAVFWGDGTLSADSVIGDNRIYWRSQFSQNCLTVS